jgi:hypothetical protein
MSGGRAGLRMSPSRRWSGDFAEHNTFMLHSAPLGHVDCYENVGGTQNKRPHPEGVFLYTTNLPQV